MNAIAPAALIKKAAKKLLPYSPSRGVRPLHLPKEGKTREGVNCRRVFPPDTFTFGRYTSLSGTVDFPPYTAEVPEYKLFTLQSGLFIFGREEVFTRRGRILEEITAQKINPLTGKQLQLSPATRIKGRVLLLGLSGLENGYYHFIIELLLRWWIFRQSGIETDYYVFSTKMPFQRQALSLMGIREDQLLEAKEGSVIQADRLICPALVNNFELAHLRGYELYNKRYMPCWSGSAYAFLREKNGIGGKEAGKLIYISRNRSARRRIINEEALLPLLNTYGFETCYLEEMSLREQAECFANARMVVAPHGAGLVNLVWSRAGTVVLELYPEFDHDPSFRLLAASLNLDYQYVICKSPGADGCAPVDESILIDRMDLIKAFLQDRLGSR